MHTQLTIDAKKTKGFTLLELLIVIAILAILATVVVLVLNPAETLKKTRDSQRLSDMNTLRAALGLYVVQTTEPKLDNTTKSNTYCLDKTVSDSTSSTTIWLSATGVTATTTTTGFGKFASSSSPFNTNATGWIPVDLSGLKGGPPVSQLPVDPTNSVITASALTNSDLIYRYSCRSSLASDKSTTFELNARMESDDFKPGGGSDKAARDGGNNSLLYEVGTDLTILPDVNTF